MNRKFGRKKDNREHMLRNLATSLVLYETVTTTAPKAKELKSFVDRILARAKTADLNTIRELNTIFFDKNAVKKVVDVLIPRYAERTSGFTRNYHLKNRLGDNAEMIRLELIDKKVFVKEEKKSTQDKSDQAKTQDAEKEEKIEDKTKVKVRNNAK